MIPETTNSTNPTPTPVPKSVPSRYRLWSTTEKERLKMDKTQPTKDDNTGDKPDKSRPGKVVMHTHGIRKPVVKKSFQVPLVWRQIFGF